MGDPAFDRYEHQFQRSMDRGQAEWENRTPEYKDDETDDDEDEEEDEE